MRKVKFKKYRKDKATKRFILDDDFVHSGVFHKWGLDVEDDEGGIASYTVAIVELGDGTITTVCTDHLKFDEPVKP